MDKVNESDKCGLMEKEIGLKFTNGCYSMSDHIIINADFDSSFNSNGNPKPIMLSCLVVSLVHSMDSQLRVIYSLMRMRMVYSISCYFYRNCFMI